jgi:hypothetical protein
MKYIPVSNTKQIPGSSRRAVQVPTDDDAEATLAQIAKRIGVEIEIAYRWGAGYYYAPVQAEEATR